MQQRYLVTGAQGFVGRYLVSCLLSRSKHVTILGIGRSPQRDTHFLHPLSFAARQVPAPLPEPLRVPRSSRYSYLSVDLLDANFAEVARQFRPTAVIHLAANLRGVARECILDNVRSTQSLLEALLTAGSQLEMLLFASSAGIYGHQEMQPISEDTCPAPLNDYARSKAASERMVQDFADQAQVPVAIARIFNVLGPGQDELHLAGHLVGQMGAILGGAAPAVIRTRSLASTRDFLDVRDVSTALALILEQNRGGIYNVGSGTETRVGDLLTLFLEAAGLQQLARIENDPSANDPIPRHVASVQRIAATRFKPAYPLAWSCRDMLEYYRRLVLPTVAAR